MTARTAGRLPTDQSTLAPEAFTIGAKRASSERRLAMVSATLFHNGVAPFLRQADVKPGLSGACLDSAFSLSSIR